MKIFKKVLIAIALFATLLGVPIVAKLITNTFDFSALDPDNAFLWFMVRHAFQVLIIVVFMIVLAKIFKINFNLGLGNKQVGLNYLKKFVIIFSIGCVLWYAVMLLLGQFQPFAYDLTAKNILGYLSFQLFFTGPSEEIIFRAFAITLFAHFVSQKRANKKISYANLFAAIVFGLAHIGVSFAPFSVSFALPQIIISIILGYFYGDCFEKSKSVVYPIIMHSFTNVLTVGLTIILTAVM
jgi:membrane protease YdiL (CAAX protease family)